MNWVDLALIAASIAMLWWGRDVDSDGEPDSWLDVVIRAFLILSFYVVIVSLRACAGP